MAVYRIEFAQAASRALKRLDERARRRILAVVAALADQPRPPGTEMPSSSEGLFRIRIGSYRVIYVIEDDRLLVLVGLVGHRREIYRKLAGLLPQILI